MKAWITVERENDSSHERKDFYYYIWSTEPYWNEIEQKWQGEEGTLTDICGEVLRKWFGRLPKTFECIELNVTEGTTWIP